MPARSIRLVGDPILTKRAAAVDEFDGALARIAADLRDTLRNQPGLAVAAPQIGIDAQMFAYYTEPESPRSGGIDVIINPRVTNTRGSWTFNEGCLSFPGLFFEIERWRHVTIEGHDVNQRWKVVSGQDLLGRVFLHEVDHLNGILMTSHLTEEQSATLRDFSNPAVRSLRKGLRSIGAAR